MRVVCLVKQVPKPTAIRFDPETRSLVRTGVPLELNELDVYAVTEAVRLREQHGGEVVAVTMGPPQAQEALRLTLAIGADRAVHLSDKTFALADTVATSRTLSLALRKLAPDLVLCGRRSVDSETGQVPPQVAAFLDWPQLTGVVGVELVRGRLRVRRETDEGEESYELPLPAVLSLAEGVNSGIWPTAQELEAVATDGRIVSWGATDLVEQVDEYDKRFGQNGSPTRVLAVRDVTPPRRRETASSPQEAAGRIVELLVETSWPPASAWEKPERLGEQPGRGYDCWSVVELVSHQPRRVSLELLGKGRELAGKLGGANVALLMGHGLDSLVPELAGYGADRVVLVDDERLSAYNPQLFAAALRLVLERFRPHVLLIPSTADGRDYGPRVAGELGLGMTGDCVDLGIDRAGRLIQHKPAYGGNIVSVIMGSTTPQLATVRAGMFAPLEPRQGLRAEVVRIDPGPADLPEPSVRLVEVARSGAQAGYELDRAEVVVCVGEEVGGPDGVAEVERLARSLAAPVGATREVTRAGWVATNRQIGLTGRAVAPRLFLAVGIDGAPEQLVGSTKSAVIACLHTDPQAPIFAASDVGLAGDWRELLPPLVDSLRSRLG